jgi:hypothetical protein
LAIPSQIPVASVSDHQMNVIYELNYNQTILSQEKEQYVILDKKQIDATYKYHTVPKLNNQVFLMAFVKNWQSSTSSTEKLISTLKIIISGKPISPAIM